MKQLDFETSNYKHKEDIKTFVDSFNDLTDKYVKNFDNCDADLVKVNGNIEKKNASIGKLEASLIDLNKKIDEFTALKNFSNEEIKALNAKKGEISYTDSEVQKMELDDINAQISSKKGKISKIDAKMDATKTKIKSESDAKKAQEKELKELEKTKRSEEEALFKTEAILTYIKNAQEELNKTVLDIINKPYVPEEETTSEEETTTSSETTVLEPVAEEIALEDEPVIEVQADDVLSSVDSAFMEIESVINEEELSKEIVAEEPVVVAEEKPEIQLKESVSETPSDAYDALLDDMFKKEALNWNDFSGYAREQMIQNREQVIKNMEILKKHKVPLEYTVDQSDIYYNISSQDLDDLLSIITTDDEGNGMGFSIDFTYNILSELSKINVDKLIDVYNSEFMNVNAKSGIINLLKLTNPNLTDFEKNRRANVEILKSLGTTTTDEIVKSHPDFVNMDNPLFVNVLNVFDKSDLVEKLNADVDVIPKIVDYWKNN